MGDNPLPDPASTTAKPAKHTVAVTRDVSDAKAAGQSSEQIHLHEKMGQKVKTQMNVADDGTLEIRVDDAAAQLSNVLKPVLEYNVDKEASAVTDSSPYIPEVFATSPKGMNIVIHIVGSRGDVQPFVSLGKVLKDKYAHRVRIATHLVFQGFVEENGLEFFSIGGDPAELMAYMVKNPGLIPDLHTLRSGDVGKRRQGIYEIVNGCWRSCIEPGDGTGVESDHYRYDFDEKSPKPFIADAIIANPPSFAHVHCAEKLGIPLHMMFTMPWSPTQSFPHPLVNIKSSNADRDVTNYISYTLVDMMTWQGLGDVINKFRRKALNLEPVSVMWAPGMTHRLRIPFTYCWSPALIPKPKDWGKHISISGFYFLSLASSYTPDKALLDFLAAGPPPVYIGFGSIVVDDPDAMTKLIFKAVELSGVRALVSQGWGGLGANEVGKPDNIFMLGNVPHDWLFKHVSAVVHHGGAGTTAAGVLAGRPTVIVPFFGDQPFWGSMIARAGAGPEPIPYKGLTAESLAQQIRIALSPGTMDKAGELADRMNSEKGAEQGAQYFHDSLGTGTQCAIIPGCVAVWRIKRTNVLLGVKAATILLHKGMIDVGDLKLHRPQEYETEDGPWDPVSGVASVLLGTLSTLVVGAADLPSEVFHALKKKLSHHGTSRENSISSIASSDSASIISHSRASSTTLSLASPLNMSKDDLAEIDDDLTTADADSIDPLTELDVAKEATIPTSALPDSGLAVVGDSNSISSERVSAFHEDLSAVSTAASDTTSPTTTTAKEGQNREHHSKHHFHEKMQHTKDHLAHLAEVGLSVPMDLASNIAQGFHNAPKIYQDRTVRPQESVTGMKSGLKAAGKDFTHGMYDGVSGVVTQPFHGAKEHGAVGLLKGIGKGLGGLVLKPSAAVFSVPADTLKGVYKELQKTGDARLEDHIKASRIFQGELAAKNVSTLEQEDAVKRWTIIKIKAYAPGPCPICKRIHAVIGGKCSEQHHIRRSHRKKHRSNIDQNDEEGLASEQTTPESGSPVESVGSVELPLDESSYTPEPVDLSGNPEETPILTKETEPSHAEEANSQVQMPGTTQLVQISEAVEPTQEPKEIDSLHILPAAEAAIPATEPAKKESGSVQEKAEFSDVAAMPEQIMPISEPAKIDSAQIVEKVSTAEPVKIESLPAPVVTKSSEVAVMSEPIVPKSEPVKIESAAPIKEETKSMEVEPTTASPAAAHVTSKPEMQESSFPQSEPAEGSSTSASPKVAAIQPSSEGAEATKSNVEPVEKSESIVVTSSVLV